MGVERRLENLDNLLKLSELVSQAPGFCTLRAIFMLPSWVCSIKSCWGCRSAVCHVIMVYSRLSELILFSGKMWRKILLAFGALQIAFPILFSFFNFCPLDLGPFLNIIDTFLCRLC